MKKRSKRYSICLTLYLLMCGIWWAPNNASKGQMGFNLAFKGLNFLYWVLLLAPFESRPTNVQVSYFIYRLNVIYNQTKQLNKDKLVFRSFFSETSDCDHWRYKFMFRTIKFILTCTSWGGIHYFQNNQRAVLYYAYWCYVADISFPFPSDGLTIGPLFGTACTRHNIKLFLT